MNSRALGARIRRHFTPPTSSLRLENAPSHLNVRGGLRDRHLRLIVGIDRRREADGKRRAAALAIALRADRSAVKLHEVPHDRES